MTAFRLTAAILVALVLMAPARADTVIYGKNLPAGEASPTDGSFSIRFPIAFTDARIWVDGHPALVTRMLTGKSGEGLRFSATEMFSDPPTAPPKSPDPLDSFMQSAGRRPGAVVSAARHERKDGMEILLFSLTEPRGGSYFRMVLNKTTLYMQVIQFPEAVREKAAGMKDAFFSSFKITKP